MPNRWLKEAYRTSPRVHAASPEARDLWVRLLVTADDYGRFHAHPSLVASTCFPLQPDACNCAQLLAELGNCQLLAFYEVEGKAYLRIEQWYERARSASKFPDPSTGKKLTPEEFARNCEQLLAIASSHGRARVTSTYTTTSTSTTTATPLAPHPRNQKRGGGAKEKPTVTGTVFDRYDAAFQDRYGVPALRNATINGQLANLVKRLGPEAGDVAAFYVGINDERLKRERHPIGLLVQRAEGYRAQWAGARDRSPAAHLSLAGQETASAATRWLDKEKGNGTEGP